jgi:hypothetical protein
MFLISNTIPLLLGCQKKSWQVISGKFSNEKSRIRYDKFYLQKIAQSFDQKMQILKKKAKIKRSIYKEDQ